MEGAQHGVFTGLLLQALHGGAANILGKITPGSLYAFVDNALDAWEQRPVFKTNVSQFIVVPKDLKVRESLRVKLPALLAEYALEPEEYEAMFHGDIGKLYVLGCNGQLLMHFAPLLGMPWADYLQAMRDGVQKHGPVRAGVYAMTTATNEKIAGV